MPFVKGDERINRGGRPRKDGSDIPDVDKTVKSKDIRQRELLSLLRKVKPHLSRSIQVAASIMNQDGINEMTRLKAVEVIVNNYKKLVDELYQEDSDSVEDLSNPPENKPSGAVFSLKMINTPESKPE